MIGIIYGALAALSQTDIKRLVAYSSVSHMGFIVLGMFALNATGLDGSVIQMVNHGLTTGALFACVGIIYERYHTREMTKIGGLWNRLPILAFFLILAALGLGGRAGTEWLRGEFPILVGTFGTSPRAAVLGATGMIFGACYLFLMLKKVIFGPLRRAGIARRRTRDNRSTRAHLHPPISHPSAGMRSRGWHPLMGLIVLIGVYPRAVPRANSDRPSHASIRTFKLSAPVDASTSRLPGTVGCEARCGQKGGGAVEERLLGKAAGKGGTATKKGQGPSAKAAPKPRARKYRHRPRKAKKHPRPAHPRPAIKISGRPAMNPPSALAVAQQTALILIPEFILLLTAMGMMTASAFLKRPRRVWCAVERRRLGRGPRGPDRTGEERRPTSIRPWP